MSMQLRGAMVETILICGVAFVVMGAVGFVMGRNL